MLGFIHFILGLYKFVDWAFQIISWPKSFLPSSKKYFILFLEISNLEVAVKYSKVQ